MKVLLCIPFSKKDKRNLITPDDLLFPLGLGYVASALERDGHIVHIFDFRIKSNTLKSYINLITSQNFDVVGFSVVSMLFNATINLASITKSAFQECAIIVGGPFVTTHPQLLVKHSNSIDFEVIGEGEITIVELLRAIEKNQNFKQIKGIVYRVGENIIQTPKRPFIKNLDSIPWPARHLVDQKYYHPLCGMFFKLPLFQIITYRGCPYNCIFCDNRLIWGKEIRRRSPGDVINEIKYLIIKYNIKEIQFLDDTFTIPKNWIYQFYEILKLENIDIIWRCFTRIDSVNPELLKIMYNSGCRSIGYGIESGDDNILKKMEKGITVEKIRQVIKWTKDANIEVRGYFMLNFPGESKESIKKTLALSRELDIDYAGFKITNPLHGEKLRSIVKSSCEIINKNYEDFDASMGNTIFFVQKGLSYNYIKRSYKRAIKGFYFRPSYILKTIRKAHNFKIFFSHFRGFVRISGV